jgi:serine/threonine-protein kinase
MTERGDDTRLSPTDDALLAKGQLPAGSVAGDYVITGFIARGGCGSVYQAKHRSLERRAAVKVLHGSLAALPKMVERFAREAQVVNLLRHPSIVEIYEVGTLPDGRPFYAMEYLEGRTLSKILEEEGRFSPAEALEVLQPVCAALAAAHAAGVVHRDVKASNICVSDDEPRTVKLLDFGIAKLLAPRGGLTGLTSEGRQVGTLTIMAPEQLLGGPVDARIDVYALGVLLFRLLTGRLPFDGKNPITLAQQHLESPAPRPSLRLPVAPALDAIVLRAMEKRPESRFDSVTEFISALRKAAGPARRGDSGPCAPARGVGIYLEIHMQTSDDSVDDALSDDIAFILDLAEESLEAEAFILASVTGSAILGVRPLPDDPAQMRRERRAAVDLAASLHERVRTRPGADPRVHANVCVHVAEVTLRMSATPEVLGGPLVRTETWAPQGDTHALYGTPEAVEGLTGFDVVRAAGPLVAIVRHSDTVRPPESPQIHESTA